MKAKTKVQIKAVALSKKLKAVTKQQMAYGCDKCFDKKAYRTKHQVNCLECGHSWKDDAIMVSQLAGNTCPKCGRELKVSSTKKRTYKEMNYYFILDVIEDMQLIRAVALTKKCKVGKKAEYFGREVMQYWITEKGKVAWFTRNTAPAFRYFDLWAYESKMTLRGNLYSGKFNIKPYKIHPGAKLLSVIRRNGFKGRYHGYAPQVLFPLLLSNKKAETLFKAKQLSLLGWIGGYQDAVREFWPSVKICLRNNYIVKDASLWRDYLKNLSDFGKDLTSPRYVCPDDLNAAHDHYVALKRDARLRSEITDLQNWLAPRVPGMMIRDPKKISSIHLSAVLNRLHDKKEEVEKREEWEEFKKKLEKIQEKYEKEKGRFLGLSFSDGDITIKTLDTIEEFRIEGEALGHCVFENKYYQLKDSLILSAQVNGVRTETIEVYLNPLQISQCRGKNNKNTEYHDRILQLLEANLHQIKKRMRVHTKKAIEQLETVAA